MKKVYKKLVVPVIKIAAILLIIAQMLGLSSPYINPFNFWPAAFMGLAFPVIWISLVICSILLLTNRKWFVLLLIFIFIGSPMMFRHFTFPLRKENNLKNEYKILTYNVHGFAGNAGGRPGYERQIKVHEFVNEQNPDVVCMQEYAMKGRKHARYIELLYTGLKLPNKHLSDFDLEFKGTSYTYLTATRYPIKQQGMVYIMGNESCGIFTDIEFPEGIVRVYNIHLQSVKLLGEKKLLRPHYSTDYIKFLSLYLKGTFTKLRNSFPERASQAWMIEQSIKNSPYPVILAGDFNDTPASYSYNLLNNGLNDAYINNSFGFNRTYAQSLFPIRIDHIFIDKKLQKGSYKRFKMYVSDHFPVMAGFGFASDLETKRGSD